MNFDVSYQWIGQSETEKKNVSLCHSCCSFIIHHFVVIFRLLLAHSTSRHMHYVFIAV